MCTWEQRQWFPQIAPVKGKKNGGAGVVAEKSCGIKGGFFFSNLYAYVCECVYAIGTSPLERDNVVQEQDGQLQEQRL